jgi:hypothetical protein
MKMFAMEINNFLLFVVVAVSETKRAEAAEINGF